MITHIITDIEGTTTSIDFVHQVLFPFSKARMSSFLASHWDDDFMLPIRAQIAEELTLDSSTALSQEAALRTLQQWAQEDRKVTPLKTLQGHIWEAGYRSGELCGHIYPDAVEMLTSWAKGGRTLAIFSSGSVAAQKLLFGFSTAGNLTALFSAFFDTKTGPKREKQSYERILASLSADSEKTAFLSDIQEELDAASECGILTVQLVRAEDRTVPSSRHRVCQNFYEVNTLLEDCI